MLKALNISTFAGAKLLSIFDTAKYIQHYFAI